MALITLGEAKEYLRVDSSDEDAVISSLISAAETLTQDVGRIDNNTWSTLQILSDQDTADIIRIRSVCKVAVLYALAYLFEHREEADHHDLTITMRNLLFSVREGIV